MASFAHELAVPFPITLENKVRKRKLHAATASAVLTLVCASLMTQHVITPQQLWVGVITKGPGGQRLSSAYEMRNNVDYLVDLGETVAKLCAVIPAGVLVFFPSYGKHGNGEGLTT